MGAVLAAAHPSYLAAAVIVMTFDRLLMSFKWTLLLASRGVRLPLFSGFKIYCAAMVWGMFLPSTVGADALRAYLTSRTGLDGYEVTASIIVERLVGFVAALLFGLLAFAILSGAGAVDERFDPIWRVAGATMTVAIVAVLLSFNERLFESIMRVLPRRLRSLNVANRFRRFHSVYRGYGAQRAAIAAFFLLTLLEQGVTIVGIWLIALGLNVDVPLWFVAGAVPLSLLIARLPIALDGLGVFEAVFVVVMGLWGVAAAEALAIALAGRVLQTLAWLPWWLLYSMDHEGLRLPKEAARS